MKGAFHLGFQRVGRLVSDFGVSAKRFLSAATGQVGQPGAAEIVMEIPFLNGSVLDAGSVRTRWVGFSKEGRNCTLCRLRLRLGLYFPFPAVNSPEQRRPLNARQQAAHVVGMAWYDARLKLFEDGCEDWECDGLDGFCDPFHHGIS